MITQFPEVITIDGFGYRKKGRGPVAEPITTQNTTLPK